LNIPDRGNMNSSKLDTVTRWSSREHNSLLHALVLQGELKKNENSSREQLRNSKKQVVHLDKLVADKLSATRKRMINSRDLALNR